MKFAMVQEWFPTQIMSGDASDLIPIAQKLFEMTDFTKHQNELYENGSTTYYSNIKYPDIPDIVNFKSNIIECCLELAKIQGVDLENNKLEFGDMWLNSMGKDCTHQSHVHGDSSYSGTFYVNNPEGASKIRFHSPVKEYYDFCPLPILKSESGNRVTCAYCEHEPSPGKLVLWNSWLRHEVLINKSETPRLSISFNIHVIKK